MSPKELITESRRVLRPVTAKKIQLKTSESSNTVSDLKAPAVRAPRPPDHYELNPLMSRMIDTELQDVMIKVWQSLPDEPKTDSERLVCEKFRTDVGDTLRNVLGLNVAKRLLNIFNKLMLKIQFSELPVRANLRSFLKKYSFVSFKRIEDTTRSFSAQVKTIQDFDRLCNTKDLRCGASRVLVSPCYKFVQCPEKLKTAGFDKTKIEKPKTECKTDKDKEASNVENTKESQKEEAKEIKPSTQTVNNEAKSTTVATKPVTVTKPAAITQLKAPEAKPITTNQPVEANTTMAKATTTPKTQVKSPQNKQAVATPAKTNTATPQAKTNLGIPVANVAKTKPAATPAQPKAIAANVQSKPAQKQANVQAKPAKVKPTPEKANVQAKPAQSTPVQAKQNNQTAPSQAKTTPKAQAKLDQAKVNKAQENKKKSPIFKTKNVRKSFEEKGDFEELDDHDILALMSGGIVLDECSGSDDE